jgi:hypothetical protein
MLNLKTSSSSAKTIISRMGLNIRLSTLKKMKNLLYICLGLMSL